MSQAEKSSRGGDTRRRLLDAAERLFAENGFDGTTLRDVAAEVGIREPGIYNHFKNKEMLYCEVLERGLQPMADAIESALVTDVSEREMARLPEIMTELLYQHPAMAALFHRALMSSGDSPAQRLVTDWLAQLIDRGQSVLGRYDNDGSDLHRATVRMVSLFNITTGYFLSQKIFDQLAAGDLMDEENIAAQKSLLKKITRLFLLEN